MVEADIIIDLDCTLVDSGQMYEDEKTIAAEYGLPAEEYIAAVDDMCRRHGTFSYSFELLFRILSERRPGLSENIVDDLNALLEKNYFFPDSESFLLAFRPQDINIVTSGPHDIQWRKIAAHNLGRLASHVWIIKNKVRAVAGIVASNARVGRKGKVFFINDAPREIEAVKRAFSQVVCIQVRTPSSWETQRMTKYYDVHLPDLETTSHYIQKMLAASK